MNNKLSQNTQPLQACVSGNIKVRCFNEDGSINNGVIVGETFYSYEVLPDGCLEIERWEKDLCIVIQ
jgi:hypothetical protein